MAISYTWHIDKMTRSTDTDYVRFVYYSLQAKDGDFEAWNSGSVALTGDMSTPYASITKEQALGWVKDALAWQRPAKENGQPRTMEAREADAIALICEPLEEEISANKNPPVKNGVPWPTEDANAGEGIPYVDPDLDIED